MRPDNSGDLIAGLWALVVIALLLGCAVSALGILIAR